MLSTSFLPTAAPPTLARSCLRLRPLVLQPTQLCIVLARCGAAGRTSTRQSAKERARLLPRQTSAGWWQRAAEILLDAEPPSNRLGGLIASIPQHHLRLLVLQLESSDRPP